VLLLVVPLLQAGAAVVGMIFFVNKAFGWELSLLLMPVVYWIYRSYHLYLGRLEDEKTPGGVGKGTR